MSVFNGFKPRLIEIAQAANTFKQDAALIESYAKQVEGVGLESLNESPSHKLVEQSLVARYPGHYQLGSGTESLLLAAAVIAGGYVVYKKLMRSKNNPVLKETYDVDKKIEQTYNATWINGKSSVGGEVNCGELTKYFNGTDFNGIAGNVSASIKALVSEVVSTSVDAQVIWKNLEPIIRNWVKATTDEDKKKYYDQMKKAYPSNPWKVLSERLKSKYISNFPKKKSKATKLAALTEAEYLKAAALLKEVTDALVKTDDATEDMWMNTGFWDLFDDVDEDYGDADDMWQYGYAENINDYFGRDLFNVRDNILDICRGLETLIVNSFK